ncbi:MAG: hypothetical protein QME28_07810 [Candidatus Saccharicenans sp.]|nr:hypothetical protein [Candidatus Saccharicenans sp.]
MKRRIQAGLVIFMALVLIISCGGKKEEKAEASARTESGAVREIKVDMAGGQVKMEEKLAAAQEEFKGEWRNIPIYPGARMTEKMSFTMPVQEDLRDLEYRFFTTGDDMAKVANYYQTEMPKRGWMGSFVISDSFSMGNYQKDGGKVIALVILDKRKDALNIILGTGTVKN